MYTTASHHQTEAPETIRGSGGRLTTEGHVGGTACMEVRSMGIGRQNSKASKNNIITLLLYCTVSQAQMHIQTHSHVQFKCSSKNSLKLSKVYPSLIADFDKLFGHLLCRHLDVMPHHPVVKLPETELGLCLASSANQCTKLQLCRSLYPNCPLDLFF